MAIAKTPYVLTIIALLVVALSGLSIATVTVNKNISSSGRITTGPNLGVYSDSACSVPITAMY